MKKIILILAILYSSFALSQKINGVYKSNFSSFINATDSSKNYNLSNECIIVVDVNDLTYNTNGSVSISNNINGETATVKFLVKSEKKYYYENGSTYLYYDGVISLSGVETKTECTIAFDVEVETLIIVYDGGNSQVWNLNKI